LKNYPTQHWTTKTTGYPTQNRHWRPRIY